MVMIEMLIVFTMGIMIVMEIMEVIMEIREIIMVIKVMVVEIIVGMVIIEIIMGIIVGITEGIIITGMVIQTVDFIHMAINFKIIVKMDFILNSPPTPSHLPSIHSILLNHSSI